MSYYQPLFNLFVFVSGFVVVFDFVSSCGWNEATKISPAFLVTEELHCIWQPLSLFPTLLQGCCSVLGHPQSVTIPPKYSSHFLSDPFWLWKLMLWYAITHFRTFSFFSLLSFEKKSAKTKSICQVRKKLFLNKFHATAWNWRRTTFWPISNKMRRRFCKRENYKSRSKEANKISIVSKLKSNTHIIFDAAENSTICFLKILSLG